MIQLRSIAIATLVASLLPIYTFAQIAGSEEDVQIRSIDLTNQILELHNFGTNTQVLDGWRFCSHDELDGFDYTSPSGLNGQSIAAGSSLFFHWNNDASGVGAFNISSLGGNAVDDLTALTSGDAVSIGLYRDSSFGSSTSLVDHLQYSYNGQNVGGATPRGGTAVGADLWGATSDWISVGTDSINILLSADPFPGIGASHSSTSYTVSAIPEPAAGGLIVIGLAGLAIVRRRPSLATTG